MLEPGEAPISRTFNGDHINAPVTVEQSFGLQVGPGGPLQSTFLGGGQGLLGESEAQVRSGFDLNHDDHPVFFGDQIEFAPTSVPVGVPDSVASVLERLARDALTPSCGTVVVQLGNPPTLCQSRCQTRWRILRGPRTKRSYCASRIGPVRSIAYFSAVADATAAICARRSP